MTTFFQVLFLGLVSPLIFVFLTKGGWVLTIPFALVYAYRGITSLQTRSEQQSSKRSPTTGGATDLDDVWRSASVFTGSGFSATERDDTMEGVDRYLSESRGEASPYSAREVDRAQGVLEHAPPDMGSPGGDPFDGYNTFDYDDDQRWASSFGDFENSSFDPMSSGSNVFEGLWNPETGLPVDELTGLDDSGSPYGMDLSETVGGTSFDDNLDDQFDNRFDSWSVDSDDDW